IGDGESAVSSLTLKSASSNPGIIPTNNIVFGGSASNRTVTFTPVASAQGAVDITIFVSDSVNVTPMTFTVVVGAPSITSVANQITYSNIPLSGITFTVSDTESAASSLIVTNSSSNPTLITNIVVSGVGGSKTLTLMLESGQTGMAMITLFVS